MPSSRVQHCHFENVDIGCMVVEYVDRMVSGHATNAQPQAAHDNVHLTPRSNTNVKALPPNEKERRTSRNTHV